MERPFNYDWLNKDAMRKRKSRRSPYPQKAALQLDQAKPCFLPLHFVLPFLLVLVRHPTMRSQTAFPLNFLHLAITFGIVMHLEPSNSPRQVTQLLVLALHHVLSLARLSMTSPAAGASFGAQTANPLWVISKPDLNL